jgi:ABC-type nickel/cobalt efflux system permease component RcnA
MATDLLPALLGAEVRMSRTVALRLAAAALFASAAAWAIHQQAAYIASSWSCTHAPEYVWLSALPAFFLLTAGSWISWRALRTTQSEESGRPQPRYFLAQVALLGALIFAFALALQVIAPLFLPGCVG